MCTGLEFLAAGGAATAGTAATAATATAATAGAAAAAGTAAASTGLVASLGGWGTIAGVSGLALSGIGNFQSQRDRAIASGEQAGYAAATAAQQAQSVRHQGAREVSAARAAIAGNNTALDEFSLINTREIERAAEQDAQMTILSGRRESDSLARQASSYSSAAGYGLGSSLLSAGGQAYTGWKGAQQVSLASSDPISSFYQGGNRGAGD